MKFTEDDFDLDEYKKKFNNKNIINVSPKNKALNILVSILVWVLAFLVAYPLFMGGQYLIDLFMR